MTDLLTEEDTFELPTCRVCGCTDDDACVDDEGIACHWTEVDLCSECR